MFVSGMMAAEIVITVLAGSIIVAVIAGVTYYIYKKARHLFKTKRLFKRRNIGDNDIKSPVSYTELLNRPSPSVGFLEFVY